MQTELKRDLWWAALIGIFFAVSPVTGSAHPKVSMILGSLIAVAIYFARALLRPRLPHLFSHASTGRSVASPPLATWMLLSATLLVFTPTIAWLYSEHTDSIWRNTHGIFVPLIVVLLAKARLREGTHFEAASSSWGAPVLLLGVSLALIDAGVRSGFVGTIGLIISLHGLSLLLLGAERTRSIAFPLALTVFLLPTPHFPPNPFGLTTATSFMMEKYLHLASIPALRHHVSYFALPVGMFSVSANCGGLSFFYGAYFLAVILAYATSSRVRRVLILLIPWPLTVLVNGMRGTALIALCNYYGSDTLQSSIHGLTGIATFLVVSGGLLLLADWRSVFRKSRP